MRRYVNMAKSGRMAAHRRPRTPARGQAMGGKKKGPAPGGRMPRRRA